MRNNLFLYVDSSDQMCDHTASPLDCGPTYHPVIRRLY